MWVLILYIYANALAKGDSVALTNVPGFKSQAGCVAAGKQADDLASLSFKTVKFICVQQ
jgi:hypothetical protein